LEEIDLGLLRNRLVLLHHFSDIFCPSIPMFPLDFLVRVETIGTFSLVFTLWFISRAFVM